MTPAEIYEEEDAIYVQQQIEYFARCARRMKFVVEDLQNTLCNVAELIDYPENLGEAMSQLGAFADSTARIAYDWAKVGDADFDPCTPWG